MSRATARREPVAAIADVSAVVVNYNAKDVLPACLASLRAEGLDEIVIVDNGSVDGSETVVRACDPGVVWVASGANLGYGQAANIGARQTGSDAVLVCNPDVAIRPGALAALVAALDADSSIGIVGPRLLNADGSIYPSARSFPSIVDAVGHGLLGLVWAANPFSRRYKLLDWDHSDLRPVDWVPACWSAGRRGMTSVGSIRPSSCTWRMSTCAGGPTRRGGVSCTSRKAR
jgi:N-acetylglucosaminyl-diphospho-decaprenol L-rhamnosyltransferase